MSAFMPGPGPKFLKDDSEISCCPFCGHHRPKQTSNAVRPYRYWVSCGSAGPSGCNAHGPIRKTIRGAIKAWNRPH